MIDREIPRPVRIFWTLNVGLTLLCALWLAFNVFVRHRGYPYNSPFLRFNHFIDFYDFRMRFTHYHKTDFFSATDMTVFSYPPPVGMLYELFYLPRTGAHTLFTIVTTLPCVYLAWLFFRGMVKRGVMDRLAAAFTASACVLSFPFWFDYMLGNVEICLFLLTTAGVLAILKNRPYLGGGILGLAGSMKLFPFILLGLLISRRQYRQTAFGLLVAGIIYPISVWLECPSWHAAFIGMRKGADTMSKALILQWHQAETSFDHSIFGIFKQTMHLLGYSNMQPASLLNLYVLCAAIGGTILYFWKIRRLPLMNQVLCLIVASILLPPMSHDYTLLHLYIPWSLLALSAIEAHREKRIVRGLYAAFVCFGVLLSPESEVILRGAAIAGQIKAMALIALGFIAMKYPFALPRALQASEGDEIATGTLLSRATSGMTFRTGSRAPDRSAFANRALRVIADAPLSVSR